MKANSKVPLASQFLVFSPEVRKALETNKPVLALESTIISHGMPYPKNVETALAVEGVVRKEEVVPATIAVLDGKIKVGLTPIEMEKIGGSPSKEPVLKLSSRDLPFAMAKGLTGGTTVAATMRCASLAGISVFSTGGIGGVHREAETTFDISADLQELANTSVTVVCAGAKSILDLGLTLEMLETLRVPVIGYSTDDFPAFYCSKSHFTVSCRLDSIQSITDFMQFHASIGAQGGILVANPIPEEFALDSAYVEDQIKKALKVAHSKGIRGKEVTPFLLAFLAHETEGRTLAANIALIENNARVGALIAKELSQRVKPV